MFTRFLSSLIPLLFCVSPVVYAQSDAPLTAPGDGDALNGTRAAAGPGRLVLCFSRLRSILPLVVFYA